MVTSLSVEWLWGGKKKKTADTGEEVGQFFNFGASG